MQERSPSEKSSLKCTSAYHGLIGDFACVHGLAAVSHHAGLEHRNMIEPLHSYDYTSMPAGLNERWSFFATALFASLGEDADNLFNWWKCTKYILFRNHCIQTSGHLSCKTPLRQRLKQNLFPRTTWQMIYVNVSGKQSASWLGSIAPWICSHLSMDYTHKVLLCGGSSSAPACWHPRTSCSLHYSFFTYAEAL